MVAALMTTPQLFVLHLLLLILTVGVVGCDPLPSSPPLDVKSARLLATVRRLADHGDLDNPMNVQEILGTALSETKRVVPGADVEECRDRPATIATSRLSTYAPSTDGFWFVRDPSLPPDKFQPTMDYSIDRLTMCNGPNSGAQPQIEVKMSFRNIAPYVCLSFYDLNVAIPHLLKGMALDSFQTIFYYRSPRPDILVSFVYQPRGQCLYSIELEKSERVQRIRSGPFWQRL
jgi:hypothetical protein